MGNSLSKAIVESTTKSHKQIRNEYSQLIAQGHRLRDRDIYVLSMLNAADYQWSLTQRLSSEQI